MLSDICINILFTFLELQQKFVYSLQMHENITLLQWNKKRRKRIRQNCSVLVDELQNCSPHIRYSSWYATCSHLKHVLALSQWFVRQFNHRWTKQGLTEELSWSIVSSSAGHKLIPIGGLASDPAKMHGGHQTSSECPSSYNLLM